MAATRRFSEKESCLPEMRRLYDNAGITSYLLRVESVSAVCISDLSLSKDAKT